VSFASVQSGGYTVAVAAAPTVSVGGVQRVLQYAKDIIVESVALRTDRNTVQTIADVAEIPSKLGKIDARNPLAVAAYVAQLNAGTTILAYGVTEDSTVGFAEFSRQLPHRADIYCVVPVSAIPSVQQDVVQSLQTRLTNLASPSYALKNGTPQRFRMCVSGGLSVVADTAVVATTTKGLLAAVSGSTGSFDLTASDGRFAASGVRKDDVLTYAGVKYKIVSVSSNQTARVKEASTGTGAVSAVDLPCSISRTYTADDKVTLLSAIPASYGSRRVVLPLATSVEINGIAGGTSLNAAYLGCAVGGMIAGLPPHQGITNLSILGITKVNGAEDTFDDAQLTKLSDAGWCVFSREGAGAPFCIHGVTTDNSAVQFSEIMSVKNFDYVSEDLARQLDRFIGTWNINAETLGFIKNALESALSRLKSNKLPRIGAPVIDGTVSVVVPSSTDAARVEIRTDLTLPVSLNTIGLHLVSR